MKSKTEKVELYEVKATDKEEVKEAARVRRAACCLYGKNVITYVTVQIEAHISNDIGDVQ